MAVQGLNRTETCMEHHDRPAVARCGNCHKPVCKECVVSTADGRFCSHTCAKKTSDYRTRAATIKKPGGTPIHNLLKMVFYLVILVIILGIFNKFMFKNNMPIVGQYLNRLPVLGGAPAPANQQQPAQPETK